MGLAPDPKIQRLGFETRHAAGLARSVTAIAIEKDSHVHLVGFFVHVFKKFPDAHKIITGITLEDPFAVPGFEFHPRDPDRNTLTLAEIEKLPLLPAGARLGPGLDGPVLDRLGAVRHDEVPIDRDDTAESLAGRTRAERAVERKKVRRGFRE